LSAKLHKSNEYFAIIPFILYDYYADKIGLDGIGFYGLLLRYCNSKKGYSFPSYDHIKKISGWGRGKISRIIKLLEKYKLIVKKRTPTVNHYFINNKKLMELNILYFKSENSTNIELPDLLPESQNGTVEKGAEFQNETPVVPKQNFGSSKMELNNILNIKDKIKKGPYTKKYSHLLNEN